MRVLSAFIALVLMSGIPGLAFAGCDIGGKAVPCSTKNGHYRIRLPDGAGPHPAVVYLYGSLGNSAELMGNDGFLQAFVDRGYAVIVPAALDLRYKDGHGSGWYLHNEKGRKERDDTAFVEEVLRDAEVRHRIDRRRVLITGMSRGGFLTWDIACHNPSLAKAYAPVGAGYLGKMPRRCKSGVRLLHTHGQADKIVPINPKKPWVSGGARMEPLDNTLVTMAMTSGCNPAGKTERFREYDRTRWSGCTYGASVDKLVHKGGHTIPLSWYSTVIDWFEDGRRSRPVTTSSGGGTARFKSVGSGTGGRFKKVRE